MPLARYVIRNEYSLADSEVYRGAKKDDSEALLEGIAMAGLIGILRQLGDLAEFATELFHDLHEEMMSTSSRGHDLVTRVQQMEADLPSVEKNLLSRTHQLDFTYSTGANWHPVSINAHNNDLVNQSELPRFILSSYQECRSPPRLFLLDKFDVSGAGACLKRYSDPSLLRLDLSYSGTLNTDAFGRDKQELQDRKAKKKGLKQKNGETLQALLDSETDDGSLISEVSNAKPNKVPMHGVKLKMRQMKGFSAKELGQTYMKHMLETAIVEDNKHLSRNSVFITDPLHDPSFSDIQQKSKEVSLHILLQNEDAEKQSPKRLKDALLLMPSNESVCNLAVSIQGKSTERIFDTKGVIQLHEMKHSIIHENGEAALEMTTEGENSDDFSSEQDTYMDALATIEFEIETDSDSRSKDEVELLATDHQDIVSDTIKDQLQQPSQSYDSRVDSNDSLGKEKLNLSLSFAGRIDDTKLPRIDKVIPINDNIENTYSLLDSGNSITLTVMNPAPSHDSMHSDSIEVAGSSVGDVLVKSSIDEGFSKIQENDSTFYVISPQISEQQSVGFMLPNRSSGVLHVSQESSCTSLLGELFCRAEQHRTDEVHEPLTIITESDDSKKSVEHLTSSVIGEVDSPSSTETSREASCVSLIEAVSTIPCEQSCLDRVQTTDIVNFPEHKSVNPVLYDVHFEASSYQIPDESCSVVSDMDSKISYSSEVSVMDEVQASEVILFSESESSIKYKSLKTAISDKTSSICFGSISHEVPKNVSRVTSVFDAVPLIPCSFQGLTLSNAETAARVLLPGIMGEYKSVDYVISDVTVKSHLEVSTVLSDVPDFCYQANLDNLNDETGSQFPNKVTSGNDIENGCGHFLFMGMNEVDLYETNISTNNDIVALLTPRYLPNFHPHGLGAETNNLTSPDKQLESVASIAVAKDENLLMESGTAETIFMLPHSRKSCRGSPTPVFDPEAFHTKECMGTDMLSSVDCCVLTQNLEALPIRSDHETSEKEYIDCYLFSNSVLDEPVSGGLPSKIVVNEMENLSQEVHVEPETLKGPPSNIIFTSDPADIRKGVSDYVDMEGSAKIEDNHISDEKLPPKIVALNVSPTMETTGDPMLLNMATFESASPQSDLSSHSLSSHCDRPRTGDCSTEILCDNGRLDVELGHPPCDTFPYHHPHVPLNSICMNDFTNNSTAHDLSFYKAVSNITVHTEIPETMSDTQSHECKPSKSGLHCPEMSYAGAMIVSISSGTIPFQQKYNTSGSSEVGIPDPKMYDLNSATMLVTSESIDAEYAESDVHSCNELVGYLITFREAQGECRGDALEDPASNDIGETVVQSTPALENPDGPKRHAKISLLLEAPVTVDQEFGHFTCANHCNHQKSDELQPLLDSVSAVGHEFCIDSISAVGRELQPLLEPFHPTQDSVSVSVPVSPLSNTPIMASSTSHYSAPKNTQFDQIQRHERELVNELNQIPSVTGVSNPSFLPHLGAVIDTVSPPPLPPLKWIMGKTHQNDFSLPHLAPNQSSFATTVTDTEASGSDGALPWRSHVYRWKKDPVIESIASHDKSRLRKAADWEQIDEVKQKPEERGILEQIRAKAFKLKPISAPRKPIQAPSTNIKIAAILEKAKAIRQAYNGTGSDDDDDADKWSDT